MSETNREQFLKRYGLPLSTQLSLKEVSALSGIPLKALEEVRDRGVGAWKTSISSVRVKGTFEKNPDMSKYPRQSRLSKEQWGYARAIAFANKSPKVYYGSDDDIRRKYKLM